MLPRDCLQTQKNFSRQFASKFQVVKVLRTLQILKIATLVNGQIGQLWSPLQIQRVMDTWGLILRRLEITRSYSPPSRERCLVRLKSGQHTCRKKGICAYWELSCAVVFFLFYYKLNSILTRNYSSIITGTRHTVLVDWFLNIQNYSGCNQSGFFHGYIKGIWQHQP